MRGAVAIATVLASVACNGAVEDECILVCTQARDCEPSPGNCEANCERVSKEAEDIGCVSEISDYYACRLEAGCGVELCDSENAGVTLCKLEFCWRNPHDQHCS